ncbi:MAPK regulated corepressor interacting protein 2-like isoform X1 [Plectropomus leopardus]|uniref:MAPK regulated corepressor interacting protein 2-like isoform X1 n=1 Tax=Plectropomus leopardus TaxID=160734 RepID=UPI001C4CBDCC|nr:MAPK regulated corepressor interacting protein 2-like isoform X1 [Plectropomus leopardus]
MMYTITRGPSKLVTQRRTGPTQQLDNKINDFKHKQTSWSIPDLPAPKIVFSRPNGKKYHHSAPTLPADNQQEESFSAAHEENVRFVHDGSFSLRESSFGSAVLTFCVLLVAGVEAQLQKLINNFSDLFFEWTRTQRPQTAPHPPSRELFRVDSFSFTL